MPKLKLGTGTTYKEDEGFIIDPVKIDAYLNTYPTRASTFINPNNYIVFPSSY